MLDRPRYMMPLDEDELFEWGATSWRMDIVTYREIKSVLEGVRWHRPKNMPDDFEGYVPEKPLGHLQEDAKLRLAAALGTMLNDPSLVPGIAQTGTFSVGGIEIQNGSFDAAWHHDGLAGKRMGHAGDYFAISYFGETSWEDEWGGQYEYAKRSLVAGWPSKEFTPKSGVRKISPVERTVMLGWNQNPRLIHRAAPLLAPKNRITVISSLHFQPR